MKNKKEIFKLIIIKCKPRKNTEKLYNLTNFMKGKIILLRNVQRLGKARHPCM